ncbi:Mediator of RNA polymerase II transcription subunit 8 [Abeliophyllum distichum]|uniref:Mediator of RNA polymerase II transcription subunit 8 n=1 Tax=Abeliophyllum distichum TaxID=126358 RepID=A0ABD1PDI4_9LAMI
MEGMEGKAAPAHSGVQYRKKQPPARVVKKLSDMHRRQLNLHWVKTRAITLSKNISSILSVFDTIARTNCVIKRKDVLGKFSMVNWGLFSLSREIKKVSKVFVVHPKNVNGDNATVLPIMLSSKLLPEMEIDDKTKREELLNEMQNLSVSMQIEKLKTIINAIGAARGCAEDARFSYLTTRPGPIVLPTTDKVQVAKIQEQENLLRSAANHGEGLRMPEDQRHVTSSLPVHLVDVLPAQTFSYTICDVPEEYVSLFVPPAISQGTLLQASGVQLIGRVEASPSGATGSTSLDNTTATLYTLFDELHQMSKIKT